MDVFPLQLEKFHVSKRHGFLLEEPLESLPECFSPWNNLAKRMMELVAKKSMREEIHKLELLDHEKLSGHRQLRLAHLQLSIIAAGYIWQEGDKGAEKVLPSSIAVPWHGVATRLGFPLIICHPSLMLANWRRDQAGDVHSIYLLPGGTEADWFLSVTIDVELAFAAGLENLMSLLYHAQCENTEAMVLCLLKLVKTVTKMQKALAKMHVNLSADTFYNELRPFLAGWGGDGSPLPDGIIYDGVSEEPKKMMGGSAAQSSTLQCIDAALGVVHKPDIEEFMKKMRGYMPPAHAQFIDTIEQHSRVKHVVSKHNCDRLKSAYNKALKAVMDFRSYHIQIVTKYIIVPANQETRNKSFEALATKGTGGSSLVPFLKSLRTATAETCVPEDSETSSLQNGDS